MNHLLIRLKKEFCFWRLVALKFFDHLPTRIVEYVFEYKFLVSKKNTHTSKKQTKEKKRKTKETKAEKEKENVVVVNSICGTSNGTLRFRLQIYSVCF